ncbi:clasp N terminal-domain-containing protein [Desarmillaria tabescens]|uniref:Clasp N terminal-domain-containing protein n=1 Tax=Armillaria tabescens TaxID=1929756 RepID=A0AA39U6R1_ARMTA|nr:clasp N terminal-domain-containing protein [Desarmillaria tabescens]KAK0468105.1 clasp N terminal-domain-containing protein [Desarmillaria tabescens]
MDPDDSIVGKLVAKCKSNDVDVKVDALTKLQSEFESGAEINDPDALINVLKACLRTSNQHLTAATLSVLPPLISLLVSRHTIHAPGRGVVSPSLSSSTSSSSSFVDNVTLRQLLTAFLPAGGLIERLGDKEKAQLKAREALVILGGFAYRAGGTSMMSTGSRGAKGPETPLAMFERSLRENGLASKVWKVREQSILTLVHIRRNYHIFPIRPYLSLLVDSLEDTDAHVRECSRQSVVELFSGPAVTDAARADLKKELTKKGVRKTIVDGVLSKLLGSGSGTGSGLHSREGSESGDSVTKTKEYVPPSIMLQNRKSSAPPGNGIPRAASSTGIPRPASRAGAASPSVATPVVESQASEIRAVYVASSRDLENEFLGMAKPFEGKETEHNWAARDQSISRVRGMLKGDVHARYHDTFMACLKDGFIQWSIKTLISLRTTVATNTISLYCELTSALGAALDPFCDVLLSNLLKMAGFTKKITAQESQAATLQEKTVQARAYATGHVKHYLEVHGQRAKLAIESSGGLETLEKSLKKSLADPNPAVKAEARKYFWVFQSFWPERSSVISESLDSVARKQLEKACPDPNAATVLPPVASKPTKKSSVAAAIAASRAKAKAIATSPPTLRHQATASHTPFKRSGSPAPTSPPSRFTPRPSSPLRTSTSPPSTRSRMISDNLNRSANAGNIPTTPPRSNPRASLVRSSSPQSPENSFQRRTSPASPLAGPSNRQSILQRAARTALPASPPSSVGSPPRRSPAKRLATTPTHVRHSTLLIDAAGPEDSLLLAQSIPIPDYDTDSDDHSINLMSFSAPFEQYPTETPKSDTRTQSLSPKSIGSKPILGVPNVLSSDSVVDLGDGRPVVEDALRARAEQAESAAERLLELVEPEEEGLDHPRIPSSLFAGSTNGLSTPKMKAKPMPLQPIQGQVPPTTPVNRVTSVMRQAALFKDSPVGKTNSPSLMDVLQQDRRQESGWWLKRKALIAHRLSFEDATSSDHEKELQGYIARMEAGDVDVDLLRRIALFCIANPAAEPSSPMSPDLGYPGSPSPFASSSSVPNLHSDIWERNNNSDRFLNALIQCLDPLKSEEELEYGLIVLWEVLENQAAYIEGHEADILSALLRIRYCNKPNVLEATNTIRDALAFYIEPVYGLTTMHASLRTFRTEPHPEFSDEEVQTATYAFGLIALGKFILRLPAEIAEEEIPRLRTTLITSLNDKTSLVVRESAAAVIIAAQLVLRDETHLFVLLDGLADEKKNLLTYLFDKHGVRGLPNSNGTSGINRLEKEMRRLDTRTSMPPRPTD